MNRPFGIVWGLLGSVIFVLGACATVEPTTDAGPNDTRTLDAAGESGALDASDGSLDAADAAPRDGGDAAMDARDGDASDARDAGCTQMCGARCVNTTSDPHFCGSCTNDCTLLPGVNPTAVTCTAGRCDLTSACMPTRGNCDGNIVNGCESNLTTAIQCGSCAVSCPASTPTCAIVSGGDGGAGYACTSGCSGAATARCAGLCVDTTSDVRNCGACGVICPLRSLASATCTAGVCGFTCTTGYASCDGVDTNGCETAIGTSATNCGTCGNVCAGGMNGTPRCAAGACALTCTLGYGDCDASPATGCETDVRTNVMNCGRCANPCPARTNATPTCAGSVCGFTCDANFGNCDALATNGCETDLRVTALNCGACGVRCAVAANATATCAGSVCGIVCNAGFGDCDGNGANGCETNIRTSATNCGACGTACPVVPGATPTCTASVCGFTCTAGSGNCDGMAANGCEVDTTTSMSNCGACGAVCSAPANATAACTASVCVITCNSGFVLSAGVCVRVPPTAIGPSSTAVATSRRPTFRVRVPTGEDGAQIQVCRDRACTLTVTTFSITGTGVAGAAPAADLAPGVYYWRTRGMIAGATVSAFGPTWQVTVSAAGVPASDATWGSIFDLNSNNYADVIVGVPGLNRGQVYAGAAAGISTIASWNPAGLASTGTSVASAGDVNGDGFADAILGAPTSNTVYVFHGSATGLTVAPSTTLTAGAGTTTFGAWVAPAGDVNGDGYGDAVVGAPGSNRAYVYLGGATGLSSTPTTLAGPAGSSNFGVTISTAGDVNADGYADVIAGGDGSETAYLYLGSATGLGTTPTTVSAPSGASGFGRAVAAAGDVNGDGYPDVIIGAYASGTTYLYHGGASGLGATPATTLTAPGGALQFGFAASSASDVNGDGYADVIVGAPMSNAAYVFAGGAAGVSATVLTTLTSASSSFGRAVAYAGDTNADGFADVIIGAPLANQAQVYRGALTGLVTATPVTLAGSGSLGTSVAWLRPARSEAALTKTDPSRP